jgi:hypothetical protein
MLELPDELAHLGMGTRQLVYPVDACQQENAGHEHRQPGSQPAPVGPVDAVAVEPSLPVALRLYRHRRFLPPGPGRSQAVCAPPPGGRSGRPGRFLDAPAGTRYTAREGGDMRLDGTVAIGMEAGAMLG